VWAYPEPADLRAGYDGLSALEQGRFALLWKAGRGSGVELTLSELTLFFEGSRAPERGQLSPAAFVPHPLVPASTTR